MVGSILLTLALIASVLSSVMYFLNYRGYNNTLNIARISYHAMAIFVIVAATLLLHAVLTHQYQYKYVYDYSGSGLPLGLLISTFYAGQEGSFFLWTLFTVIVGVVLQQYSSKRSDLEPRLMAVFTLSAAFLLTMISPLLKNPFAYIWMEESFISTKNISPSILSLPFIQSFLFTDNTNGQAFVKMGPQLHAILVNSGIAIKDFIIQGKGLNPLLQNFWMQIHPPMLFTGFSMSTVPFAFAIAALMKNDYKEWVKQAMPWVLSGTMILGFAIMLGGYWAYGVLGWGGYWGWDPVENSSLVPWLVGVASVHTLLVQKKSLSKTGNDGIGEFAKTNLLLCILTYVLVLYSTFLTRSGILGDASVHSFTDPGYTVYLFLIIFISTFTLIGIAMMIYRWKFLSKQTEQYKNLLNRELALFTGAVTIMASALIVLVGTSAPIFGSAVETKFYNELNLPIAIIIGILNGFSLLLKWKFTDGKDILKKSVFSVSAAVILTLLIIIIGGINGVMMFILTLTTSFALFVNLEIAYKIVRGNIRMIGPYVAHIGIAVFLLGIVGTAHFSEKVAVKLPKGQPQEAFGYTLTFNGYEPFDEGQKYKFNIEVKKGNSSSVVSPVMFVSAFNNSLMREPDILKKLTKDLYIEPTSFEDGTESKGSPITLEKGGSTTFEGSKISFESFDFPKEAMSTMMAGGDFQIGAKLKVEFNNQSKDIEVFMKSTKGQREFIPIEIAEANLKVDMTNLEAGGKVSLILSKLNGEQTNVTPNETLMVEASVKPFINLVWLGVIFTAMGFFISAIRRAKESNQ
ncbi:MAG: cytochrome c biogenesis protein CcsA [Ignavibacteriales bacterium]|nr:cytochrome c biogenesis protein CcsA [Ignavibacteriales bacterium]